MDKLVKIDESSERGIVNFLKFLLENKKVSGVFTLRKTNTNGSVDYGLITETSGLDDAIPLHPLMPANAGQILSRFTPVKKPIAAVIKPCELHAFVELVKRTQGTLDNFLLISYSCGGAFPFKATVQNNNVDKLLPDYWKTVLNGEVSREIRPTCKGCEYFVPMNADITISLIGEKNLDTECRMFLHTDKGKTFAEGFNGTLSEEKFGSSLIDSLLTRRKTEKEKLFNEVGIQDAGLDGMIDVFGKCIGCHGCSRVCPICYCILCDFESHKYDDNVTILEKELVHKGATRLPPDTILYQIGRLIHMSFSCVGCGLCAEVCPANIPVSTIFMKTGGETAKIFEYIPGKDVEEPIPVMIFKKEELTEIGED